MTEAAEAAAAAAMAAVIVVKVVLIIRAAWQYSLTTIRVQRRMVDDTFYDVQSNIAIVSCRNVHKTTRWLPAVIELAEIM